MAHKDISRRKLLKLMGVGAAATTLAACQPKVVKETVVIEKEVGKEVEKVVKETVEVEKEVTRVVEKEVPGEGEIFELRHHIRAGDIGPLYETMLEKYNREHPNIKAVLEPIPGGDAEYVPKLMTMHAAGTIGDSCWTSIGSVNHYQYADMGITVPLDEMVESTGFDKSPFYTESWESSKYEGKLYGLPLLAHPGAAMLVYNKTLFEEEGVEEPNEDWTLEDMAEAAEHFTRDTNGDGRIDSWGLNPTAGRLIVMLIRCFSGYDYDMINPEGTKAMVNAPKTKEGLRWVTDLYQKYDVTPTPQAMETGFNQLFMSGRCAMYQTGCWGGTGLTNAMRAKDEYPVTWWLTSLPKGPSGVLGSHAEVDCECVLSQSEHKEAAFELITYFVTKEAGVLLGLNFGCAGARADQYEDDRLRGRHFTLVEDKTDADLFAIYNRINENAGPFFYPANLHGQEAFQVYDQALTPLWVGKEEATDAFFDQVNEQLQTVLDKPKAGGE